MTAFLVGLILGFIGSMPVAGPISVMVLGRALRGQTRGGLALAFGASIPEAIWCGLAFWGAADLVVRFHTVQMIAQAAAIALPGAVGVALLWSRRRSASRSAPSSPVDAISESSDRWPRDLASGFGISAVNPALILTWTGASAALHGAGVLAPGAYHPIVVAVGASAGIVAWFAVVVFGVRRFGPGVRRSIQQRGPVVLGIVLLAVATVQLTGVLRGEPRALRTSRAESKVP